MQDKDEIYGLERLGLQFLGALRREIPPGSPNSGTRRRRTPPWRAYLTNCSSASRRMRMKDEASASDPVVGCSSITEPTMPTMPNSRRTPSTRRPYDNPRCPN